MTYAVSISASQTYDAATNSSTVTAILYFRAYKETNGGNWAYWNYNTSWWIKINGELLANEPGWRSINTDAYGNVNSNDSGWLEVGRRSKTFTHNGDGTRVAIGVEGNFTGSGGYSPGSLTTSSSVGALDASRPPNTANAPTLSRNGGSITMSTSATVPSGAPAIDYYHWYYSTDNSNFSYLDQKPASWTWTNGVPTQTYWFRAYAHNSEGFASYPTPVNTSGINGVPLKPSRPAVSSTNPSTISISSQDNNGNGLGIQYYQYRYSDNNGSSWTEAPYTSGSSWTFSVPDTLKSYIFSTRAYNSSGWGAWSDSQNSIPGRPPTVTTSTPVGLKAFVYAGQSVGPDITQYYVSASQNGGASWETEIAMGLDREYQYSGLSGGKNYLFRVRSRNASGYSAYTILSEPVFVPAGGRRWTGEQFVPTATVKRRTDSGWETVTIAKRWTGTSWEVLT